MLLQESLHLFVFMAVSDEEVYTRMIISLLLIIKVIIKPQVNHFSNIVQREKQERKQLLGIKPMRSGYMTISALLPSYIIANHMQINRDDSSNLTYMALYFVF